MSQFISELNALNIYNGNRVWVIDDNKLKIAMFRKRPEYPSKKFSVSVDNRIKFKNEDEIFLSEHDAYVSITGKTNKEISDDLDSIEIAPYKTRPKTKIQKIFCWWNRQLDKLRINGY